MKVLSPERMAGYDGYAIETWGIPSAVLMENAGRSTYRLMKERYLKGKEKICVVCGRGNNGGDGFVVARYAALEGFPVRTLLLAKTDELKGDAALNMELFRSLGGGIDEVTEVTGDVRKVLAESDLLVDAIFGTGLSKEVEGREGAMIEEINRSGKPVIAIDIPSGIDGRTGRPLGTAVRALHTFTYGYPKLGQILYPGAYHAGRLTVINISIPPSAEGRLGVDGEVIDGDLLRGFFRRRLPWDHKGTFGHAVVIAGSPGKTGAAAMTSLAALKIGAGLVTLVIPRSLNAIMAAKLTEVMTYPVEDKETGFFVDAAFDEIAGFVKDKDAVIMGPGLSRHPETMALMRRLYREIDKPFVIDADGINAFQGAVEELGRPGRDTVLTPHPGEFGGLMGLSPRDINADRIALGRRFVESCPVNLVLKGARSLIFDRDGTMYLCPTGNPALAKGGSGDILTGFIGGLRVQGYSMIEAALFGTYLHGYIADRWVERATEMDLLAGDLLAGLPEALREIGDGKDRVYIEKSL